MSETNGEIRKNDTRFQLGNPGKPKGAVVKINVKVRESIMHFLEANIDQIQADFDNLKPRERLQFVAELLPYAAPKLSSQTTEGNHQIGITINYVDPGSYAYPAQDQNGHGIPESV